MKYILRTIEKDLYCISVWDMEDNMLTFNVGNRRTILRVARDLNINIKGHIQLEFSMLIKEHFKKMLVTLGWFGTGASIVSTTVLLYKALSSLIQMSYTYKAKLIRCVDGDTADIEVDLGFYMSARIRGRLDGVDTPERGKPDFQKATAMLENLISVNSDEDGCFIVRTGKTGKYGRWLITIQGVNDVLASIWPYDKQEEWMLTKHESQMLSLFDVRPYSHYKHRKKAALARPSKLNQYMEDRVNKLRELYSKHEPEYDYEWILPEGETDGRKSIKTEIIVGEDISPFDLEDFEELMPSIEDYIED